MTTTLANATDRYSIRKSVFIAAPPARVWNAVSSAEGLQGWLAPDMVAFEPRLGGRVHFRSFGCDLTGEIVAFTPPQRLAFTWNQTPPSWPEPTLLTIELVAERGGTRVHVVHSGFDRIPAERLNGTFEGYKQGWAGDDDLRGLQRLVEGAAATFLGSHAIYGGDGPAALEVRMGTLIKATPAKVWSAISTQEGMRHWMGGNTEFEPRLGGRFVNRGVHGSTTFIFSGTVQELVADQKLVVGWESQTTPFPVASQLTIELEPVDGGTWVKMVHHGFERLPDVAQQRFLDFRGGWDDAELAGLRSYVEGTMA